MSRGEMKADYVIDPAKENVQAPSWWRKQAGWASMWCLRWQAIPIPFARHSTSCGEAGEFRLLGLTSKPISLNFSEDIIFKGITVQGINGRRMYQTWYQMTALLKAGKLDLHPVITDRMSMKDFSKGNGTVEDWRGQQDSGVSEWSEIDRHRRPL